MRDACRFPLAGPPLHAVVKPGARVAILTDVPALPLPGASVDPRRQAIEATVEELRRLGVRDERQTVLVAAGLSRRPGRRDLERLFSPAFARTFYGPVHVHDVESPDLVELEADDGGPSIRIAPELVNADLVVVVTAAETVLHGGPAALLAAGDAKALLAAGAESLLEASGSTGWQLAVRVERALARRVAVLGVSLALDQPRIADTAFGYPYDRNAIDRLAASRLVRMSRLVPGPIRLRALRSLPEALTAAAAFAGPPSIAHAEALLRAVDVRSAVLETPLDVICLGIPRTSPHLPRERPNPLLAAYIGLGLALRLWRDRPPVVDGGTAILLHRFHRHFSHPTQQPYRAFFAATRGGLDPELIAEAERTASGAERALRSYREGRTCHPLLPFSDWAAIRPQAERLGSVIIGGCRDAGAARQLGFVPAQNVGIALDMARGLAGDGARVGFLVSPPYFPVTVGT